MSSAAEGTVSSSLIQAGCNVAVTQQPNWTRFHNQKRKKLMSWNFLLAEKARLQQFCKHIQHGGCFSPRGTMTMRSRALNQETNHAVLHTSFTQINSKYSILPFHLPWFKTKNQIDKDTDPKQSQSVRRTKSNHQTRPRRLLPLLGSTVTFESFRWWPYIHEETGYRQERYFIGWRGFRFLPRHPIVLENAGLLLAAIVYQDLSRWNPLSSLFPAVCRVQAK